MCLNNCLFVKYHILFLMFPDQSKLGPLKTNFDFVNV